jgi:hypothetical protein
MKSAPKILSHRQFPAPGYCIAPVSKTKAMLIKNGMAFWAKLLA